jgi:ABC-2 type transport system ATP-binding protein
VSDGASLEAVRAGYGLLRRRVVLDGLDLIAAPGEVTAVVGANGVGKTTMFRVLLGFLSPWTGRVDVCGKAPAALRRRRGIGYMPESVALPVGFTAETLLREGARLAGLRGAEADAAVEAAASEAELEGSLRKPLESLSKGTGRRVALAYVRLGNPPLLLLDEPLSGLDPRSRVLLRSTIAAAARSATVIVASHDLGEVERTARVVYVLDRGRVIRRLEADEVAGADLEKIVLQTKSVE